MMHVQDAAGIRHTLVFGHRILQRRQRSFLSDPHSNPLKRLGNSISAAIQIVPEKSEEKKSTAFEWSSAWYPVAVEKELDKRVPTGVSILGYDLVLWWDIVGKKWQVFEDKCPHRLAPLSEGRISENGHIQCSYHGWTFAPVTGSCSRIPQAPLDGNQVEASPKACVTVYPNISQQGILWFLPKKKTEITSILQKPPFFEVLEDPSFVHYWATSNLPYGYEALIENLVDPAHVPFAHHKLQGNRKDAKPLNFAVNKFEKSGFNGTTDRGFAKFIAPCTFANQISFQKKEETNTIWTIFMCVPVSPGHSKVFWTFPRNFARWGDLFTPMWLAHLRHMLVLDSDLYFLHIMERKQAERNICYTPTSSDAFVLGFRRWLKVYGGGAPKWGKAFPPGLPPTPPKRMLMDRYENHVKNCPTCKGALSYFERVQLLLQAVSIALVAMIAVCTTMPKPIMLVKCYSLQIACVAVLCCISSIWLSQFINKNYHFHDYNHALVT